MTLSMYWHGTLAWKECRMTSISIRCLKMVRNDAPLQECTIGCALSLQHSLPGCLA